MAKARQPWTASERSEIVRIYFSLWGEAWARLRDEALWSPILASHLAESDDPEFLVRREIQAVSTVLDDSGLPWTHIKPKKDGVSGGVAQQYIRAIELGGYIDGGPPAGVIPVARRSARAASSGPSSVATVECPNDPGMMVPTYGECGFCGWSPAADQP